MCKHEEVDFDHPIWYFIEEQPGDDYWVEYEAAFVKIDGRNEKYGCLDCGERKRMFVENRVEVVWKDHLSEDEYAEFEEVHSDELIMKLDYHEESKW